MTVAGLTLPRLSALDLPVAGEGSLDPLGLAVPADRLADLLVPGVRARMSRIRFVTLMAVSSLVCETLAEQMSADDVSTPSICFEWLVLEAFTRRSAGGEAVLGLPGIQKARATITRGERLSAATYLKGPRVFGFYGVYKPFAVDAGVVGGELEPGLRALDLVRAWERDANAEGFADDVPGSVGARLRRNLRDQTSEALRAGRCVTNPRSPVMGLIADHTGPGSAEARERKELRRLVVQSAHELRTELTTALLAAGLDVRPELADHELLVAVRRRASRPLGEVIDAMFAYEELSCLLDAAFADLCRASNARGRAGLTPSDAARSPIVQQAARDLPSLTSRAADRMADVGLEVEFEQRLGSFADRMSPPDLAANLLAHHDAVQAAKPPAGKRSWFVQMPTGWVVRDPYGGTRGASLDGSFLHPMRVYALNRFLRETTS